MLAQAQLIALQTQFAAAIRDPDGTAAPADVPVDRMDVYRELFFNNVRTGLESVFPVALEVLDKDHWLALVRHFWRDHQSSTPEYPRMAREFLAWFEGIESRSKKQAVALPDSPPWLFELLIWEHAELEVMLELDDQINDKQGALRPATAAGIAGSADAMRGVPVITRSLRVFAFDYPVHRISTEYLPDESEPTFLATYRTPQDQVDFIELTAPSAAFLNQLAAVPMRTGAEHVADLAAQWGLPVEAINNFAADFLQDLLARQIILYTDNK